MAHIFISYSTKDSAYAYALADKLRDEGFDVWIDENRLRSSEDWWRSIVAAIDACAAFVVVLTPNADNSKWVQREITLADQRNKPLFPLLLEGDINTPNWSIFVRTQYEDVRSGTLPPAAFYESLGRYLPRKDERGAYVTDRIPADSTTAADVDTEPPPPPEPDAVQARFLEAAMPACTKMDTPTQLKIKVTLPDSDGLRLELPEVLPSGDVIQQDDVRKSSFTLRFRRAADGTLLPADTCLEIDAPDFARQSPVPEQHCAPGQIPLVVPPEHDSRTLNLALLPRRDTPGLAWLYIRLYQDGALAGETSVETRLVHNMSDDPMCGDWRLQKKFLELRAQSPESSGDGLIGTMPPPRFGALPDEAPPPPAPAPQPEPIAPSTLAPERKKKGDSLEERLEAYDEQDVPQKLEDIELSMSFRDRVRPKALPIVAGVAVVVLVVVILLAVVITGNQQPGGTTGPSVAATSTATPTTLPTHTSPAIGGTDVPTLIPTTVIDTDDDGTN